MGASNKQWRAAGKAARPGRGAPGRGAGKIALKKARRLAAMRERIANLKEIA